MFPIKNIMETDISFVNAETHAYVAMNLMVKEKRISYPVVDENMHLVGIITERDFLRLLISGEDISDHTVSDYMTKDVTFFNVNDSAVDVCEVFMNTPILSVPVVEDEKLVGVVYRRDILYLILRIRGKILSKKRRK